LLRTAIQDVVAGKMPARADFHKPSCCDEAKSMVPNIDPEQVCKLASWGLTQNDKARFVGWRPQPSAVGPVLISLGFSSTCAYRGGGDEKLG
jgi:hypothetical protein